MLHTGKRKVNGIRCFLHIVIVFMLVLIALPAVCIADNTYNNVLLEKDDHDAYALLSSKGDNVEIDFSVITPGAKVDVYIMTYLEYRDNYMEENRTFEAVFSRQNVSVVKENWKEPDDQSYYLVIDNENNSHPDDAEPVGSVRYNLFYDDKWDEKVEEILGYGIALVVGCCAITIIIIIVVIWLIVRKKKTDTVVIQGPAGYPPGAPPQYPYQQPPQYQQQQPPQYQQQQPPQYQQQPPQNQQQQYQQQQPPQNQQPQYQPQKPPENQQKPPQY